MKKLIFMLFLALCFDTESACREWLSSFEPRWGITNPEWHYDTPQPLKDGRYYVSIIPAAVKYLTEAEKLSVVELSEADLPDPPPMP